jgi:hypothetical protein
MYAVSKMRSCLYRFKVADKYINHYALKGSEIKELVSLIYQFHSPYQYGESIAVVAATQQQLTCCLGLKYGLTDCECH